MSVRTHVLHLLLSPHGQQHLFDQQVAKAHNHSRKDVEHNLLVEGGRRLASKHQIATNKTGDKGVHAVISVLNVFEVGNAVSTGLFEQQQNALVDEHKRAERRGVLTGRFENGSPSFGPRS